ncbi:hypothetical protein NB557_11430 [Vibrio alginolyticus]|nr:hypothetical protein [Vibrio alginolyticus]
MQGFRITTLLDDMDLDVIYEFISNSYWGKGIPRERLEKSLRYSFCFAVLDDENQLVAFARLIIDLTTFAYLAASSIAKPTKMLTKPLKLSKDGVLNMIKSLPIY